MLLAEVRRVIRKTCIVGLLSLGMALSAPAAMAQVSTIPVAISAAKPITFEVASIRLHAPGTMSYGPGFTDDGLSLHGMSAFSMIFSFLGALRTEGIPQDMMREGYDIQAKVADEDVPAWKQLTRQQRNLAVQALLEDRFKLKFHRETRQMPGYSLIVAKSGPKFKESTPGDTYAKGFKGLGDQPLLGVMMGIAPGVTSGQAVSMAKVAEFLAMPAGRPVLDKTGLTGTYDLTLKLDPPAPPPPPSAEGQPAAPELSGASIFTVIQEQLGLKLESGATVPVEFLVVDHIERPSPN